MLLPARHFLGWDAPLVNAVADWLLRDREILPETLVVVPTGHSARRLRQALARQGGGAVFSPRMLTPDALFRPQESDAMATQAVIRAAWHQVLLSAPASETEALRPMDQDDFVPDRAWSSGWTDLILPTLNALGEVDIRPEEVPIRCPAASLDARKWETIGRLARRVEKSLAALGLVTPELVKRRRALDATALPADTARVVLAGVPDPVRLACVALDRWMEKSGVPVQVLVHAPADMEGLFDVWGRPEREGWKAATLPLPNGNDSIQVLNNDEDVARAALRACAGREAQAIALACPDDSLLPALERAFAAAGWPLYNPGGRSAGSTGLVPALSYWLDLLGSRPAPFAAVAGFLRSPAAWDWLRAAGLSVDPFRLATTLDLLAVEFLPETLDDAIEATRRWPKMEGIPYRYQNELLEESDLHNILTNIAEIAYLVEKAGLAALTGEFFDRLKGQGYDDGAGGQALKRLAEAVDDLGQIEELFPKLSPADLTALWRATLPEIVRADDDPGRVLDVLGWLELPYEPGAHLVVAGMVEGKVPDAPQDHALLPDSVRRSLGLRDQASRATRDTFLWRSLLGCREVNGSVTVLVPKFDGRGEPRRPSSLLFRCLPIELPERVAHCFCELDESRTPRPPIRRGAWHLDFGSSLAASAVTRAGKEFCISPTRIRDYLECPFRYYLRHIIGMDEVEANPRQWEPRKFGSVLHELLCKFGQDEEIRDCDHGETIHAFLMRSLDEWLTINHSKGLSLPVDVQIASARERLKAFAYTQAAHRSQGWQIQKVEWRVGGKEGPQWSVGGAQVSMVLDRVDFHPASRTWRVLDYKTGSVKSVEKEHLENHADWKSVLGELLPPRGKGRTPLRWKNVQLPLYAAFLRQSGENGPGVEPGDTIETGYVLLSRAASETGFSIWDGYDASLEASALEWSAEVVRRLRAGIFGPPTIQPGKPPPEPWASLAPDGWEMALANPLPAAFAGREVSP
ncbi:MAG: PD-(D/E)XK nuclease family protein [Verrucomicrobiales bacterium]